MCMRSCDSAILRSASRTGPDGKPAIPHRSKLKVKLQAPAGWWAYRVPAWIKWVRPASCCCCCCSLGSCYHALLCS